MGHYSQLYIGNLYLRWKYDIPAFLTFLFDEADYYCVKNEEEEYFEEIGYKTSTSKSLAVLDKYGYDLDFFSQIYHFFYPELQKTFIETAKEKISENNDHKLSESEIDEELAKHLAKFPKVGRWEELEDFVKFIRALMCSDFKSLPFDQPYKITLQDGKEYQIDSEEYLKSSRYESLNFIDYEALQMYVLGKSLNFPPWILNLCQLFDESFFYEYPEIISLMFLRCVLEAVSHEKEIKLELSDIVETEQEVLDLHSELANSLVEKVNLYNKVFHSLFLKEEDIRTRYIHSECKSLIESCSISDKYQKGLILERIVELLFGENGAFEVIDKRVSTGDEEIDLVIKNTIGSPFWQAFNSPLFFVECKNWNKSVGSKEIRDFEIKLQNHSKLAKIGFFVSYNGFTSEAITELKRAGREDYHIVLLDKNHINDYLKSKKRFYLWLENIVSVIH